MLPCLRITLSLNGIAVGNLSRSSARSRAALTTLRVARRDSTAVTPTLTDQEIDRNASFVDSSAMEFLCNLDIDADAAAALLSKASIPLDATQLEALCFVLHTVVQIPVAKLPELLLNADSEFLTLSSTTISTNYKAICAAWPTERQLQVAIIAYPNILKSSFPRELQRCLTSLRDMGFSTAQTAAAVVRCPQLTKFRRYEYTTALAQCGINSKIEDDELFEMLSKNPSFLTPDGSRNLSGILEAVKKATGLTAQQAQHIVARCPSNIFQQSKKHVRKTVDLLLDFGLTQTQIGQAALHWPKLLCRKLVRIEQTLAILSTYKVTPTQVATYPHVFTHNPERIIVPRLAYLKKTAPEKITTMSLASFFSSTDEAFSAQFSINENKTYLKYKIKVFIKYQMGVNAAAAVAAQELLPLAEIVDFTSDDEEELEIEDEWESDNDDDDIAKKIRVAKSTAVMPQEKQAALQRNTSKIAAAPLVSNNKKIISGGPKQALPEGKSIENNDKRKHQHQEQKRRFFKITPKSGPKKTIKGQPQQQLQRLTPEQLEKAKAMKK
jgi:hypothetical protein